HVPGGCSARMKERVREALERAVRELLASAGDGDAPPAFQLDPPRDPQHGDFATNAAMMLGKRLRKPPRAVAEELAARLGDAGGIVASAEIAGPGFLNLRLAGDAWQRALAGLVQSGADFGRGRSGGGARVQVEFVSANPTG